jgi:hypothetical protein
MITASNRLLILCKRMKMHKCLRDSAVGLFVVTTTGGAQYAFDPE